VLAFRVPPPKRSESTPPSTVYLVHFIFDGMFTVPCEAINARAEYEVCVQLPGHAEELVDITLSVANMNAAVWCTQKLCCFTEVL